MEHHECGVFVVDVSVCLYYVCSVAKCSIWRDVEVVAILLRVYLTLQKVDYLNFLVKRKMASFLSRIIFLTIMLNVLGERFFSQFNIRR